MGEKSKIRGNRTKILNLNHNKLINYKPSEHIDWTHPNSGEIRPTSLIIGDKDLGNYTEIDNTGLIKLSGNATVFDDIQVNVSTARVPASNDPTWTTYDYELGGIAYPVLGFIPNDYLDFYVQTSHRQKINTQLAIHIHYTIPATPTGPGPSEYMEFTVTGVHAADKASFAAISTISKEVDLYANADEGEHHSLNIGNLNAATSLSHIYSLRITRTAPASGVEYAESVYVLYIDCHFEIDQMGSKEALVK